MSPCRSLSYDNESPVQNVANTVVQNEEVTTITTITSAPEERPTHAHKKVHVTTKTVEEVIVVVSVSATTVTVNGSDRRESPAFVTLPRKLSTSRSTSSTSTSLSTSRLTPSTSASASSSATDASSSSATSSATGASSSSASSSVSSSSSSVDLQAVSGAKASIQDNRGSPTGPGGTVLQASISSTSHALKATTTNQSTPVGAIVGVTIAGVLVLALAALLLVLWTKRRSARVARHAAAGYEGGMQEQPPITPYPSDLQPNRAGGGGRVQNWMRNSRYGAADQSGFAPQPSHPQFVADSQYPFAPPIIQSAPVPSPHRPGRQRGDTLSSVGYF